MIQTINYYQTSAILDPLLASSFPLGQMVKTDQVQPYTWRGIHQAPRIETNGKRAAGNQLAPA